MKRGQRIFRSILLSLAATICAAYPTDWLLWHARQTPTDTVTVNHYTVASLKGSKEDWYIDGTTQVTCSQSLFPQGTGNACWYQRRHTEDITHY